MPCGYVRLGEPCEASVCLGRMAAHYEEAHGAEMVGGSRDLRILDDGSKSVEMMQDADFPHNGKGWFACSGLGLKVLQPTIGGSYTLDFQRIGANELRFAVRQLGRGPPRHRLASVKLSFGPANGLCVQYPLSRALAADERLGDVALCAGTPPAVGRVDPALLAPALVHKPGTPRPWYLAVTSTLVFQVARDA